MKVNSQIARGAYSKSFYDFASLEVISRIISAINPPVINCRNAPLMKIIEAIRSKLQNRYNLCLPHWHLVTAGFLVFTLVALLKMPSSIEPETASEGDIAQVDVGQINDGFAPLLPQANPLAFDELDLSSDTETNDSAQKIEIVRKGDNLAGIFKRAGLTSQDLAEIFDKSKDAKILKQLRPGHKLAFTINQNGALDKVVYTPDLLQTHTFDRHEERFAYTNLVRKPQIVTKVSTGVIKSSLYEASKAAKITDQMVGELAKIFAYDVDFALDLRRGDTFKVIYEEAYVDGKKIGTGKILAAEFTNDGSTYRAVRYQDKNGDSAYFSPDGRALRKGFLRTPVEFSHISSGFSLGRLHPILNKIRAHKGTDYSAPTGTPIRAAGDGRVTMAGINNGYGNCVTIQHDKSYTTLYGHMSRFAQGLRKGSLVKQGEIIGYVGSTGLATGPHLHYEFYVNGKVVNPVTAALPKAQPIAKGEMARFTAQTQPLIAQLASTQTNPVATTTVNAANQPL